MVKEDRPINMIRLDIEGLECNGLYSAEQIIDSNKDIIISWEW